MTLLPAALRFGLVAAAPLLLGNEVVAAHDHAHDDGDYHHHMSPHSPPEPGSWHVPLDADGPDGAMAFESPQLSPEEALHHESLHGRIEPDHLHLDHRHHGDVFESCLLLCYEDMAEMYGVEFADKMQADGFHFVDECPDETRRKRRLGTTSESRLQWNIASLRLSDGKLQIPYAIQYSTYFTQESYDTISLALSNIEAASGVISFVPHTSQTNYIKFQYSSIYGCAAQVGRFSPTNIFLGWCRFADDLAAITHEVLHALGFWHEQSRPDRDDHVIIQFANIEAGRENNFNKQSQTTVNSLGSLYDYSSLMHYPNWAFTKNGSPTIVATRALEEWEIMGQRVGMSSKDITQLRLLYQCSTGPRSKSALTLQNLCSAECKCWAYALGTCDNDGECMGDLECGTTPADLPKGQDYEDQLPFWEGSPASAPCTTHCHPSCCNSETGKLMCRETCGTALPFVEEIPPRMCLPPGLTAKPSGSPSVSLPPSESPSVSIGPTMSRSPTESPTDKPTDNEFLLWYVDWTTTPYLCKRNCDGPPPCGGVREWVQFHDTMELCCDAHLYWIVQENGGSYDGCSSIPETTEPPTTPPPTSSPTTKAPSTSPTTAAPSSSPTDSPTDQPTTKAPSSSPTTADPSSSPTESPSGRPTTPVPSEPPTTANPTAPPTPKPTNSPNAYPYYIDWASDGGTCKNDGKAPAWLANNQHSTREKCCSAHLNWRFDKCMGRKPTPSNKWYINWSMGKCVKECERSEGGSCGGLKPGNWVALHSTPAACCSAHMSYLPQSACQFTGRNAAE